jgi:hypothetical protein
MNSRPGRPPKLPDGETSTITLRIKAATKRKLMTDADAVGMSLTEFIETLVEKGI